VSEGKLVKFLGYASKLTVNLAAGAVLLDATADIEGLAHIVSHRAARIQRSASEAANRGGLSATVSAAQTVSRLSWWQAGQL
jgi:hypothetical protein